jgi:hypothetical protein
MDNILQGSSNIYRTYLPNTFKDYNEYKMLKCVDIISFKAFMGGIKNNSRVIVSVVENFVTKAGNDERNKEAVGVHEEEEDGDKRLTAVIKEVITEYVPIIHETAKNNPKTLISVVRPILRPSNEWYQVKLPVIRKMIDDKIINQKMKNVSRTDAISVASQQFATDGVHLTAAAGKIFVEGILTASEDFFNAEEVDLTKDDSAKPDNKGSDVSRRITLLEEEMKAGKSNDNLLFARIREELYSISNRVKEDRVLITGITSSTPAPAGPTQRKKWLNNIVMSIINDVDKNFKGKVLFVNQGRNNGREILMVEIRLDSVEAAAGIRKAYAETRKAGKEFGQLFIGNCIGLSTRVRVDIMKAFVAKITNSDQVSYVSAFTSRPILHVKPKKPENGRPTSFTFSDAVAKYGSLVKDEDLGEAYRRAGTAFTGQLEQHFVVLRDGAQQATGPMPGGSGSGKGKPESRKRKFESTPGGSGTSGKKKF